MYNSNIKEMIIYEDREILVCHKPAGLAVQNARIGSADLESGLKNYIYQKNSGKMPYLAVIHRLDQPVEGLLVFGLTKKAAASLSKQISNKDAVKKYLAVTDRAPLLSEGILENYLKKEARGNISSIVPAETKGAKKARLVYKILETIKDEHTETGNRILTGIRLETGRHHQIRVQMAGAGMPLLGDRKYNPEDKSQLPLGLCSCYLEFKHPGNGKKMEFRTWPKGKTFEGFTDINW